MALISEVDTPGHQRLTGGDGRHQELGKPVADGAAYLVDIG